jgi:hypothetical protein
MTATPDNAAPDPQQIIAELQRKLDEARAALATRNSAYSERIAYQAAANDVLKVMSTSPGDPQPVFDLISIRARDLCDAYGVTVCEFDGSLLHWRAATGVSENPAVREAAKAAFPLPPTRDLPAGRAILDRAIIHIRDYETEQGLRRFSLDVKSSVVVPLMRAGVPIGTLQMGSRERGGFSDTQVELLKTFADQAVIAIENARLFHEVQAKTRDLSEALTYQTGSANILKVIASSPTDVGPVMKAIVESACELCGAYDAVALLKEGEICCLARITGRFPCVPREGPSIGNGLLAALLSTKQQSMSTICRPSGTSFPKEWKWPGTWAIAALSACRCCVRAKASARSCCAVWRSIPSVRSRSPCCRPLPTRLSSLLRMRGCSTRCRPEPAT